MATILDMVDEYSAAMDEKARLEELVKATNAVIAALKEKLALAMVDEDAPKIEKGGYTFTLTPKTRYSKRSEEAISEAGLDFFEVLRENGLGDIIKETVNANTLQSAITAYLEEADELPEDLNAVISVYEYNDVTRRKAAKRKN